MSLKLSDLVTLFICLLKVKLDSSDTPKFLTATLNEQIKGCGCDAQFVLASTIDDSFCVISVYSSSVVTFLILVRLSVSLGSSYPPQTDGAMVRGL